MAATKMENNAQCPCRSPVNRSKSFDKNAQAQKLVDLFEIAKAANVKLRLGTVVKN